MPALPMFGASATIFWSGEKSKASTVNIDMAEVAKIADNIVKAHAAGSDDMAAGAETGAMDEEVDVTEHGVDGNDEPTSELDKLVEEAREEKALEAGGDDVGLEGITLAGDDGDLLQDISDNGHGSAGDGTAGPSAGGSVLAGESTSSSSTDLAPMPPPPTPPPEHHRVRGAAARRSAIGALASVEVDGGFIAYYSKGVFEANCKTHDSCVVSRTVSNLIDRTLGRPRGGRPLGVMVAWLSKHRCATKADHWDYPHFCVPHEERLLARLSLQAGLFLMCSE